MLDTEGDVVERSGRTRGRQRGRKEDGRLGLTLARPHRVLPRVLVQEADQDCRSGAAPETVPRTDPCA